MSGKNEATATALISDFLSEKSLKEQSKIIDSGFLSSENLSGDLTSELSETISTKLQTTEFSIEKFSEVESMKIDSGLCCVSEGFSKLKLTNPLINDLSTNRREKSKREPWTVIDRFKVYEQDEDGDTYLHAAIAQGHPEIALALIRVAPSSDCLDIANEEGFTPLHLAVATNQWRIVRWLIVAGAQPAPRNARGESPLHVAARIGSVNCCRAITEPVHCGEREHLNLGYQISSYKLVNLDQWDYEGQTCIHVAALNGHLDVLRLLVWHGANVNAREGKSGYTVLHYAVETQNDRLVYFLLTECEKLDADTTTYGGRSALQLGLPLNRGLVNALLSKGVVASPFSSEEDIVDDSDDEMICENSPIYMPQMVNGCA